MISPIENHRSIRKYLDKQIPGDVLNEVLLAATRASNTGNMQLYSMVVTTDADLRQKLWTAHFKQQMVLQAPVHITFCADINRFSHWCRLRNADASYDNLLWFINASMDAALASQNLVVEAEANGLGICYLGTVIYNADQIIEILQLPKGVFPVASLVMGYPAENPDLTDRLPLEALVHYDVYTPYTANKINEIYTEKENLQASQNFVNENAKQNLAQVFTDIRYKRSDNEFFSGKVIEIIRKQGFAI